VSDGSGSFDRDKTRLCPSCRMQISVLATKCRFCGENVGRPRVEDRHFTIQDLGGESDVAHSVNESLIDALEEYRKNEFGVQESELSPQERRKAAGKARKAKKALAKSGAAAATPAPSDQVEVSLGHPSPGSRRATPDAGPNKWVVLAIVGGVLALVFVGGGLAVSRIRSYMDPAQPAVKKTAAAPASNTQPKSRALDILESGGTGIEAFRAAADAVRRDGSAESRKVLDMARARVDADINALLNRHPFSVEQIEEACRVADEVVALDSGSETSQVIRVKTQEELFAYTKMTIADIDEAKGEATLRLLYPEDILNPREVIVKKGDTVRDRFVVRSVTSSFVRFEDTRRSAGSGQNRMFKAYRNGTIE